MGMEAVDAGWERIEDSDAMMRNGIRELGVGRQGMSVRGTPDPLLNRCGCG